MKLPFRTKLCYGIGGTCDNALYMLAGTYLLLYLTTVAGLSPAVAGAICGVGSIWEALCAPIVGFESDHAITRYGKRKPFLLGAAIPVVVITTLLFTSFDAPPAVKVVYSLVMVLAYWTCFSSFFVPYMAWGSELTDDYNERTVLRSFSYIFNQLGMCVGMVLPPVLVDLCAQKGKSLSFSWTLVGLVVGICGAAALFICAWSIKNDDKKDFVKPEKKRENLFAAYGTMFREYLQLLKMKPVQIIIGSSLAYLIANITFSSDRVFFMTFNMGMSESQISAVLLLITAAGVATVPFIAKIGTKVDKKDLFKTVMAVCGILMIAARVIGIESWGMMIFVCMLYAAANATYWQLMPSMIYDVCEVEELLSGTKHSGAVISLQALSESISIAVGLQMLGIVLQLAGFNNESAVQTPLALEWVQNAFAVIPGAAMILVSFIIRKSNLTKEVFNRVKEALARRYAGEEVDITEFEEIFE